VELEEAKMNGGGEAPPEATNGEQAPGYSHNQAPGEKAPTAQTEYLHTPSQEELADKAFRQRVTSSARRVAFEYNVGNAIWILFTFKVRRPVSPLG
jgi:hypothetical protein